MKKLNEVKVGDTLYCLAYSQNGESSIDIVPITAKEIITNGPDVERKIYSKEAIIIKEKVPNTPEKEGEYVIDQYYRGDECSSHSHGIYTTYEEARKDAIKELYSRFDHTMKEMKEIEQRQTNIVDSIFRLKDKL
jgi:hypothetical protein